MRKIILKESQLKYVLDRMINEQSSSASTNNITTSTTTGTKPITNPPIEKKKGFDKTISTKLLLPGIEGVGFYLKLQPQLYPTLIKIFNMVGINPDSITTFKNTASLQKTQIALVDCGQRKRNYYIIDKNIFKNELTNFCEIELDETWLKNNPTRAIEIPKSNYGGGIGAEAYKLS